MKFIKPVSLMLSTIVVGLAWMSAAQAFQQDFPTGEDGYAVSFVISDAPGSLSSCVISVARGLPTMGLSINLFKNDAVTVNTFWPHKTPQVAAGKQATLRINSVFLTGTVISNETFSSTSYRIISIRLTEKEPARGLGFALTDIIFKGAQIEMMADGKHFPSVHIPPAEGMNAALLACVQYQTTR